MAKYKAKLILDYISGNDIDGFDLDTLENDLEFMMSAINYTNDKNLYQLCSDNIKKNYTFIKFMIQKFGDDFSFVNNLAKEYLSVNKSSSDEEIRANCIELAIIISNLAKKVDEDAFFNYRILLGVLLLPANAEAEMVAVELNSGMGFVSFLYDFEGRDIIIEECAKNTINSILHKNKIDFKKMLHKRFASAEEVKQYGIIHYLIELFRSYDIDLGNYLQSHLHLIDNLKDEIFEILKNWDFDNHENEKRKFEIMKEQVYKYFHENEVAFCLLSDYELFCFIANDLGILEQALQYVAEEEDEDEYPFEPEIDDCLKENDDESDDIVNEAREEEERRLNAREFYPSEIKHYNDIKRIMLNILFQKIPEEPNDYISNTHKVKIIQLPFKQAKER